MSDKPIKGIGLAALKAASQADSKIEEERSLHAVEPLVEPTPTLPIEKLTKPKVVPKVAPTAEEILGRLRNTKKHPRRNTFNVRLPDEVMAAIEAELDSRKEGDEPASRQELAVEAFARMLAHRFA